MIVLAKADPVLVDREALIHLTGRSKHTIRLRCTVVRYSRGRALYAMEEAVATLAAIPTRRPRVS